MAQYKTHTTVNIVLFLPLAIWGLIYFYHPSLDLLTLFGVGFLYSTLFMNPDMDLANKIKLLSIRGILSLPFRFYSLIFKHRGISHSPILGTATRILWLTGFVYLLFYICNISLFNKVDLKTLIRNTSFLFVISGIALADICHLFLDFKKH